MADSNAPSSSAGPGWRMPGELHDISRDTDILQRSGWHYVEGPYRVMSWTNTGVPPCRSCNAVADQCRFALHHLKSAEPISKSADAKLDVYLGRCRACRVTWAPCSAEGWYKVTEDGMTRLDAPPASYTSSATSTNKRPGPSQGSARPSKAPKP